MNKNKLFIDIKCDNCKHFEICKYSNEFEKLTKKINEIFYEKAESDPFDVEATCKHFLDKNKIEPYWPEGVKGIKPSYWENPCDKCPSNPKYNPLGIQVGDTPCTFCPHNLPTVYDNNLTTSTTETVNLKDVKLTDNLNKLER